MEIPIINVQEDFIDIFDILVEDEKIRIGDSVANLFCLKVRNRDFEYSSLTDALAESIITYCLSKKEYDELYMQKSISKMNTKAKRLFRNHTSNDGELGEIILYSFLESHLKAPKILSKMRLKTSTNDYVKRADGIHLLKIDDNNFEIIFGESKMYNDITKGISEAIKSIYELTTRDDNNISDEIELLNTHIPSEFAEENYEFIKRLIKPTREHNTDYDISFGVFVGFEVDLGGYKCSNIELKRRLQSDLKNTLSKKLDYISKKIKEVELENHNFYIYLVPFTNIDENRKSILGELTS